MGHHRLQTRRQVPSSLSRSDNCVKNHFYSLLRKALRKLNRIIQEHYRREIKEIKPNVLYRIVEVSEERFKLNVNFDKEFVCFSNCTPALTLELKN